MNCEHWYDTPPSTWYRTPGAQMQNCGACGKPMLNTVITNVRGGWEHFECARNAYFDIHAEFTEHSGTENAFLAAARANAIPGITHDQYSRGRSNRFAWKEHKREG